MPELPEVETIVRGLRGALVNRRVVHARLRPPALYRAKSLPVGWLVGRTIAGIERIGKNAVFRFDPDGVMAVNLGMTGQLLVSHSGIPPGDDRDCRTARHVHGRFGLAGGIELLYRDIRRFGYIYVTAVCDLAKDLGIGPDPFQTDARYLRKALTGRRAPIKSLLLDQRIVSGLGNIYADEALFDARIDPRCPGGEAAPRARRILASARRLLRRAIAHHGSTIRDYRRPDGGEGGFQRYHAVYRRHGRPCPRCRVTIQRIVLSGRGTHFCPSCQS